MIVNRTDEKVGGLMVIELTIVLAALFQQAVVILGEKVLR